MRLNHTERAHMSQPKANPDAALTKENVAVQFSLKEEQILSFNDYLDRIVVVTKAGQKLVFHKQAGSYSASVGQLPEILKDKKVGAGNE